jgi:SAM-dependent methyltransferase
MPTPFYADRSDLVQLLCPAPKRHLQRLARRLGCKTGLDIGCGAGSLLTSLRGPSFRSTGIDADSQAIEASAAAHVHDDYICADFLNHEFSEPFDVVVLQHVLEHFPRDTGFEVLRRIESLARVLVYVETPHGFFEQHAVGGSPFQRHLSGWFPMDLEARGYTCFGSDPRFLRAPPSRRTRFPVLRRAFSRATRWYYFRRPHRADMIAGIRHLGEDGSPRLT